MTTTKMITDVSNFPVFLSGSLLLLLTLAVDAAKIIELFTFDMDIPAYFRKCAQNDADSDSESNPADRSSFKANMTSSKRQTSHSTRQGGQTHSTRRRNKFLAYLDVTGSEEMSESNNNREDSHYPGANPSTSSRNKVLDPTAQRL